MKPFKENAPGNLWVFPEEDEIASRERNSEKRTMLAARSADAKEKLQGRADTKSEEHQALRAAASNDGEAVEDRPWRMKVFLPAHVTTPEQAAAMLPRIKAELENPPPNDVPPPLSKTERLEAQLAAALERIAALEKTLAP